MASNALTPANNGGSPDGTGKKFCPELPQLYAEYRPLVERALAALTTWKAAAGDDRINAVLFEGQAGKTQQGDPPDLLPLPLAAEQLLLSNAFHSLDFTLTHDYPDVLLHEQGHQIYPSP